jgi:hypothetical protein
MWLVKLMINDFDEHTKTLTDIYERLDHYLTMRDIYFSFWVKMSHGEVVLFIKDNIVISDYIKDLSDSTICKILASFFKKIHSLQPVSGGHVIMNSWIGSCYEHTKMFKVKKSVIQLLIDILDGKDISKHQSSDIRSLRGDAPDLVEHEMYSQCQELKHQIEHRYEDEISNLQGKVDVLMRKISDLNKEKLDKMKKLDKVLDVRARDVVKTFNAVVNEIGEHL